MHVSVRAFVSFSRVKFNFTFTFNYLNLMFNILENVHVVGRKINWIIV